MPRMIADGVQLQTCVTSPPYWGLRDYGVAGQIGLEETLAQYIGEMVDVFRMVRELLKPDGTLWLNLGDCYAAQGQPGASNLAQLGRRYAGGGHKRDTISKPRRTLPEGMKPKDLVGVPWAVACALRDDGWYLRADIVWHKPNPMPESVEDRPTKAHEYLFLLARSPRYFYDSKSIQEPARFGAPNSPHLIKSPYGQGFTRRARSVGLGANARPRKAVPNIRCSRKPLRSDRERRHESSIDGGQSLQLSPNGLRNKRSVWTVATAPFRGAHFATFPPKLIEPCILAGSRPGDVVFDPFAGSGTTRAVATRLARCYIGCELNPEYSPLELQRLSAAGALKRRLRS